MKLARKTIFYVDSERLSQLTTHAHAITEILALSPSDDPQDLSATSVQGRRHCTLSRLAEPSALACDAVRLAAVLALCSTSHLTFSRILKYLFLHV